MHLTMLCRYMYQFLAFNLQYPRKIREKMHILLDYKRYLLPCKKTKKKNYGFSFDILSMKKIWLRIFYIASCNDGTYPRRPKTTQTSEDSRTHPVLGDRGSFHYHSSRLCNLYKIWYKNQYNGELIPNYPN